MIGSKLALDTNQAIALLNNRVPINKWLESYAEIWLPIIVVGELYFGAENSKRRTDNLSKIESLCQDCRIATVTEDVARSHARIRLQLRTAGTPIPENDVWIAAICVTDDLTLATDDSHFDAVAELLVLKP